MSKLFFMALILIIIILTGDVISIGLSSRKPLVLTNACDGVFRSQYGRCESGTASISVSSGSNNGQTTVSFPTPFSFTPNSAFAGTIMISPMFSPPVIATGILGTVNHVAYFQSSNSVTWSNMPATLTELYGTTTGQNRIEVDWVNAVSFEFCVLITTASTSANSFLTVYYDTAGISGSPSFVNELSTAQEIQIGGGFTAFCGNNDVPTAIPAAALQNKVALAVFGKNGAGAGDSPAFSEIWIRWTENVSTAGLFETWNFQTCATIFACSTTITGSSSMLVKLTFAHKIAVTGTFTFTWTVTSPSG